MEGLEPEKGWGRLTPRQLEVARLTAEGLSARDIAGRLGMSEGTVANVRRTVRRRLGLAPGQGIGDAFNQAAPPSTAEAGAGTDRRNHHALRKAIATLGELSRQLDAQATAVYRAGRRRSDPDSLWQGIELAKMAEAVEAVLGQSLQSARIRVVDLRSPRVVD